MISSILKFLYILFLFVIMTPGVLVKLPKKELLLPQTIGHGILFTIILCLSKKYMMPNYSKDLIL